MARKINPKEYQDKRGQILDAAQRLIYTKGYEQLTIQDVLDELKISKGAFYHYFDSKQALLEAIVERYGAEAEQIFRAILDDGQLTTLARLQRFFDAGGRWKSERKEFLLALLRVWYTDDNALVRAHVEATMAARTAPMLTALIEEGARTGELNTPFPDQAGAVVLALLTSAGNSISRLILSDQPRGEAMARAERLTAAYNDAVERVLGAPPGSLHLIDTPHLRGWFIAVDEQAATLAVTEA